MTVAVDLRPGRHGAVGWSGSGAARPATTRRVGQVRRLWIVPAAVVLVAGFALLPRVGDGGPGPGEARVQVDGAAEVARADGTTSTVTDAAVSLGPGDVIEVIEGGAHFALVDEITFQGRAEESVAGRGGTTVRMGLVPELVAGPLLVQAPTTTTVAAAGSEVSVGPDAATAGSARLSRGLGLGVASYGGGVELTSAGREVDLVPLRRVEVAARGVPGRSDLAVRYSAADAWDRVVLDDALAVDAQLGPLLAGLAARPGPDLRAPEVLRRALPELPREADLADLVDRASTGGDALVLATLALRSDAPTFEAGVAAVTGFRAVGAEWGLVATDQGVAPTALLAQVRAAVDRLDPAVSPGPAGGGPGPVGSAAARSALAAPPPGPAGVAAAPGGPTGVPSAPGPSSEVVGATGPGDPTGVEPAPDVGAPGGGGGSPTGGAGGPVGGGGVVDGVGGGVGGAVGGVTDGVGGAVGGVTDGVGGAVGGVTDGVGGAVSGVGGAVGGVGAGGPLGGVTDGVGGAVEGVGGAVGGLGGAVGGAVGGAGGAAGGVVGGTGAALGGTVAGTGGALGGALGGGR